jgi:hypothetical protein
MKNGKKTPQRKDLTDDQERIEARKDAFVIDPNETKGKRLLLFDDLYGSGATVRDHYGGSQEAGRSQVGSSSHAHKEGIGMKTLIGGSRAVSKRNEAIRDRLDEFIRRGEAILIGDANGADKAAQQHFADRQYPNVQVFCRENCRNNISSWPIRNITPPNNRKDFTYYAAKDLVMSRDAGCGVIFWDGKSKGTLQNMLNLMAAGRKHSCTSLRQKTFTSSRTNRTCKPCWPVAIKEASKPQHGPSASRSISQPCPWCTRRRDASGHGPVG